VHDRRGVAVQSAADNHLDGILVVHDDGVVRVVVVVVVAALLLLLLLSLSGSAGGRNMSDSSDTLLAYVSNCAAIGM
jgi:hypothetical protein